MRRIAVVLRLRARRIVPIPSPRADLATSTPLAKSDRTTTDAFRPITGFATAVHYRRCANMVDMTHVETLRPKRLPAERGRSLAAEMHEPLEILGETRVVDFGG